MSENAKSKPPSHSIDLPLSQEARSRMPSSLKASGALLKPDRKSQTTDIISLSTGRPHPQYYPFESMAFSFTTISQGLPCKDEAKPNKLHTGRYDIVERDANIDLSVAMSYGYSAGSEQLIKFLTEHVEAVHDPPYSDWECALTIGSTSALDLAVRTLSERSEGVLVEEYTYSGMLECLKPLGREIIPVKMDEAGLCPVALDHLLGSWESGRPKPRLLYIIPTGQNPTGITQDLERRRAIYQVAEKHDLLILEDDPYYYLAFSDKEVVPSYLSLDTSGRVLRFDSTSKILAPGLRCAWMVGRFDLIQKFLHLHDLSVVCPSGVSQLVMYKLLGEVWGHEGFSAWLSYLRGQYFERLRIMAKACDTSLPKNLCSWNLPTAGMFLWVKVDWRRHKTYTGFCSDESDTILSIEDELYETALAKGVLCCKGSIFNARERRSQLFVRLTFATATESEIVEAVRRFAQALHTLFA